MVPTKTNLVVKGIQLTASSPHRRSRAVETTTFHCTRAFKGAREHLTFAHYSLQLESLDHLFDIQLFVAAGRFNWTFLSDLNQKDITPCLPTFRRNESQLFGPRNASVHNRSKTIRAATLDTISLLAMSAPGEI